MAKKPSSAAKGGSNPKPASRRPAQCTSAEKRAVDKFLDGLLRSVESTAAEHRRRLLRCDTEFFRGQFAYWDAAAKALRWARGVNRQRKVSDA